MWFILPFFTSNKQGPRPLAFPLFFPLTHSKAPFHDSGNLFFTGINHQTNRYFDSTDNKLGGILMNRNTKIIKVKKNDDGDIIEVMLENGDIYPLNHAIMMAKHGAIEGVNVSRGKDGGEYLRADPNGSISDNLDDLPRF